MTEIIDGKAIAADMVGRIGLEVASLGAAGGPVPSLAVVRVGEDPASAVYVANKIRACARAGIRSIERHLAADITEAAVLAEIAALNADPAVHGILVQLPLPPQLGADRVLAAVDPGKDVDGFHVTNAGLLASGQPGPVPCTPLGCLMLLRRVMPALGGKRAVVLGRSNIVGKPMAALLLREDCTVTIGHSRTIGLDALCREAEILVAAVGRPGLVRGDWIRPGSVVIDVGINRIERDGRSRLVGDVATEQAMGIARAITPVPGGVGPMTVACLLSNTLDAARRQSGHAAPSNAPGLP